MLGRILIGIGIALPFIIAFALSLGEDCPRVIAGWDCRGKNCDHSPSALQQAKELRRRHGK